MALPGADIEKTIYQEVATIFPQAKDFQTVFPVPKEQCRRAGETRLIIENEAARVVFPVATREYTGTERRKT